MPRQSAAKTNATPNLPDKMDIRVTTECAETIAAGYQKRQCGADRITSWFMDGMWPSAVAGVWSVGVALAILTPGLVNRWRLPTLRESMDVGAKPLYFPLSVSPASWDSAPSSRCAGSNLCSGPPFG